MSKFTNLIGDTQPKPLLDASSESKVEKVTENISIEQSPLIESEESEVVNQNDLNLFDLTKKELEDYARTLGLELDRRHSKKRLIQEVQDHIDNS